MVDLLTSQVYRGMYKDKAVAVKVFSKGYHENVLLRRYKDLRDELTIMTHLEHPHVMSLVGVNLKPLALVLELAPYGSLRNHIDLCPHGMQSGVVHQILYQVSPTPLPAINVMCVCVCVCTDCRWTQVPPFLVYSAQRHQA